MGGDHKCPVCDATFTRPQHVARHMRSHTGDRPYKCQYCGDQFARSDLLSRHVNKCHANEKPVSTAGIRRKGSASASRATTSKQVCDQCVQANTSCDGCNPCAKCIQRKFRCTFVKFHRQTAPVGPGHNTRPETSSDPPSPDSVSSSRISMYHPQQPEDDFILGPPPSVVPTMAETLYGATPFTFPPLYPTNDIGGDNTDYVGKYRAHAELFGPTRSGMGTTSSSLNSPTTTATGIGSGLYDPRPASSWLSWGQQDATDAYHHHHHHHPAHSPPSMNDKDMQAELAHHHHQQQQHQQRSYMNLYPVSQSTSNYNLVSDPNNTIVGEPSDIIDFAGSDSASHSSCSVPSSAASSSVHLPLAGVGVENISASRRGVGGYDNNGATTSSSSSSTHHHRSANAFSSNQHHHHHHHQIAGDVTRPEFSSAFGLLSLDDPNVMAGIATDGTPFFDHPNQAHNQPARNTTSIQLGGDVDTPMPNKRGSGILSLEPSGSAQRYPISTSSSSAVVPESGSSPSRERDSKELKEFWKQYMRLPLTGSGISSSMSGGSEGVTPIGNVNGSKTANSSAPPPGYRRPRVASLPSVKTPIMERESFGYPNQMYPNQVSTSNANVGDGPPPAAAYARRLSQEMPAMSREDLRSYEAAVMARKAPTMLNLKVKRPIRGRGRGLTTGGKPTDDGSASSGSPRMAGDITTLSHSSSSSSLANAFGRPHSHSRDHTILAGGVLPPHSSSSSAAAAFGRPAFMDRVRKEDSSSPSLSPPNSSFSADLEAEGEDRSDIGEMEMLVGNSGGSRPSFKRLPSQTLGPDNQKRPFYGFGEEELEARGMGGWGGGGGGGVAFGGGGGGGGGGNIAERRRRMRRMSEPSKSVVVVVGSLEGEEEDWNRNDKSSRGGDVSAVQSIDESMAG